jgi:hypothetical protein
MKTGANEKGAAVAHCAPFNADIGNAKTER